MSTVTVLMECISDLHVGSGETNFHVIDNEVEKDPVTGYPMIHSSGLKGALRAFSEQTDSKLKSAVNDIFGSSSENSRSKGKLKFLIAEMIALPKRASKGPEPYYLVSTKRAVERYWSLKSILSGKSESSKEVDCSDEGKAAEGIDLTLKTEIEGRTVYLVDESSFREMDLSVVARNCLENGISKNLWYEELVPHGAIFAFHIIADSAFELLDLFANEIDGKCIQFGGGATIGYGLCKLTVLRG